MIYLQQQHFKTNLHLTWMWFSLLRSVCLTLITRTPKRMGVTFTGRDIVQTRRPFLCIQIITLNRHHNPYTKHWLVPLHSMIISSTRKHIELSCNIYCLLFVSYCYRNPPTIITSKELVLQSAACVRQGFVFFL